MTEEELRKEINKLDLMLLDENTYLIHRQPLRDEILRLEKELKKLLFPTKKDLEKASVEWVKTQDFNYNIVNSWEAAIKWYKQHKDE